MQLRQRDNIEMGKKNMYILCLISAPYKYALQDFYGLQINLIFAAS